ncbi:uroporphyrinogen-III C-methyltransferase [Sulfuriferula nivalis]|uniref:uroporphyrinogen-III C-methyltransferase n=1 Tax=Sulfuriferula nivalis TaxID=2675298 RepID=A0A809RCV3_9PROT|nr:uroporphyrinogen-III C-methyltransferase [Sulfuriferula nivalis]BBO99588.1 uroporphyrinogen-III C-methyltransferase [Sulfuriferula nivalis]
MNGKVYLIGAGPGDPELITLKAVRILQTADVVLVDDLVNPVLLEHARKDARIIYVGKRGGCLSTPQEYIQKQMIAEARAGLMVARLKGGDPFMFGRGGEEIEALRAAGIAVEVISGITSGIAAPASLGVPVTHRDSAPGVTFVTGHSRDGNSVNWQALAASRTTLVIYMGVKNLPDIVAELLAGGMRADMPALAIQSGTLANQRQVQATLQTLHAAMQAADLGSPAIIVLGEVVKLADIAAQAAWVAQAA